MPRTRKLGRYPILTLKEARDQARKFLADPQAALNRAEAGTFKQIAEEFIKRHVDANHLRSKPEIERCLNKYVYPQWQDRSFTELRRGDVSTLLDQIVDNHGPRQADMVLAIVSKMCNWYLARNDNYTSPVVRGMKRTKAANRARTRILNDDEIRALWKACDGQGTFGAIVKTLILTAQRREKVATMRWEDLKDGVWNIPTERVENSELTREKSHAGTLHLPQIVIDIIGKQPIIAENPYVFAAGVGNGPFNSFSQRKQELDEKLPKQMPPWVLHDLRRSARSLMSRAGVRPDIAERVLGHAIAGVEGTYDRHRYEVEMGGALKQLAHLVDQIINPKPSKVVRLPTRRG